MPVYSKKILSGSQSGQPIQFSGTTSPGDEIHTVQATSTGVIESLWLWAENSKAEDIVFMLEMGSTATADLMFFLLQSITEVNSKRAPIFEGLPLTATTTVIRGRNATATDGVRVFGYYNLIATG